MSVLENLTEKIRSEVKYDNDNNPACTVAGLAIILGISYDELSRELENFDNNYSELAVFLRKELPDYYWLETENYQLPYILPVKIIAKVIGFYAMRDNVQALEVLAEAASNYGLKGWFVSIIHPQLINIKH